MVRSNEHGAGDLLHARVAFSRRNKDIANRCADELVKDGYDITHVGGRGVDFIGTKEQIEATFNSQIIVVDDQPQFFGDPDTTTVTGRFDAVVYFPERPEFTSRYQTAIGEGDDAGQIGSEDEGSRVRRS